MATVLATKLFEPRVPALLVARPRLIDKLTASLSSKLTLISAPAGYGKSTLLSEWRATADGAAARLAWVSVDAADNDPVRFWTHAAAALQRACPGVATGLADLLVPAPGELRSELEQLLNEMAELTEPLVVVLDDLHAISNPEVFDQLGFLITQLPPLVRLVVASRADPPLPLASLRARGDLAEIRVRELCFTHDEVSRYLGGQGIILDSDVVGLLGAKTEGWAAGVHLAALTMSEVDDGASFVRSFAGDHRAVVDFLVEEVLARQHDDVREFLLLTSVLERMSAPLCDAVTGRHDGQEMLRAIESANLFLVPLDNTRTWFRYHHLFAELLRGQLQACNTNLETELHRRAAMWLADNRLVAEAVPHAIAARDWDLAIDIGARHGVTLITQGQTAAVWRIFESLPEGELRSRPEALLGFAWLALRTGDVERVRDWLGQADAAIAAAPAVPLSVRVDAELLRGILCSRFNDIAGTRIQTERMLQLLSDDREMDDVDHATRVAGALLYRARVCLWEDDLATAERGVAEALNLCWEHQLARGLITGLGLRGLLAAWDGRAADACRDADEARERAQAERFDSYGAWAELTLAIVHAERLQLEDAERHVARSLASFRMQRECTCIALAESVRAEWLRSSGRSNDATDVVRVAFDELRGLPPPPPLIARRLARTEALVRSAHGDHEVAIAIADGGSVGFAATGRIALARGDPAAAIEAAARVIDAAPMERRYRHGERLEALLVAALAHAALGETEIARARIISALAAAAPSEYVARFVELGEPIRRLLVQLTPNPNPAVAGMRKRVLDAVAGGQPAKSSQAGLVDKLTERELAVLRRLPSSMSAGEIARMMYVSLNTVKTQTQSIYRKLGVNSRHEAVEAARQLGLL